MKTFCETEVLACHTVARADRRVYLNIKVAGLPALLTSGETVLFWDGDKTTPKCRTAAVAAPSRETTTLVAALVHSARFHGAILETATEVSEIVASVDHVQVGTRDRRWQA